MITICLFKGNIILTKITSNRMIKIPNNIGKNVKFSEYIYIYVLPVYYYSVKHQFNSKLI